MAKSERQIKLKRRKIIFGMLSTFCWVATAIIVSLLALNLLKEKDCNGVSIFSEQVKSIVTSVGITVIIAIATSIFIKDKIRTFVYMLSLVLSTIMYKDTGMYVVLAIWMIDEYVIYAIYKRYKRLYEIRKEIDLC